MHAYSSTFRERRVQTIDDNVHGNRGFENVPSTTSVCFCIGVTNIASSSSHFHPTGAVDGLNDFEFNNNQQPNYGLGYDTAAAADTSGSETGYQNVWTYPPDNSYSSSK